MRKIGHEIRFLPPEPSLEGEKGNQTEKRARVLCGRDLQGGFEVEVDPNFWTGLDTDHQEISIRRQCELLGMSRSSYYYDPAGEPLEDLKLIRLIDGKVGKDRNRNVGKEKEKRKGKGQASPWVPRCMMPVLFLLPTAHTTTASVR